MDFVCRACRDCSRNLRRSCEALSETIKLCAGITNIGPVRDTEFLDVSISESRMNDLVRPACLLHSAVTASYPLSVHVPPMKSCLDIPRWFLRNMFGQSQSLVIQCHVLQSRSKTEKSDFTNLTVPMSLEDIQNRIDILQIMHPCLLSPFLPEGHGTLETLHWNRLE